MRIIEGSLDYWFLELLLAGSNYLFVVVEILPIALWSISNSIRFSKEGAM